MKETHTKIKDAVNHLFYGYGADRTTKESYKRMLSIIDMCQKEFDAHPGLEEEIENYEYFIIKMMCDNWKVED